VFVWNDFVGDNMDATKFNFDRVSEDIFNMNVFFSTEQYIFLHRKIFYFFPFKKNLLVLSYFSYYIDINYITSRNVLLFICERNIGHYLQKIKVWSIFLLDR